MMTPIYAKKLNLCVRDTNQGQLDRHLIEECHSTLTECHAEICSALSPKVYNYKITTPALNFTTVVMFTASTPASSNRTRNETTGSSFFFETKVQLVAKKGIFLQPTRSRSRSARTGLDSGKERVAPSSFFLLCLLEDEQLVEEASQRARAIARYDKKVFFMMKKNRSRSVQ